MLLVLLPLRSLGALLRPLWRLWNQNGLSTVRNLFEDLCLAWRDPVATAAAFAPTLERQRLGLARRLGKTLWSWAAALGANEGAPPLHVELEPSGGPLNRVFGRGTLLRGRVADAALAANPTDASLRKLADRKPAILIARGMTRASVMSAETVG